MSAAGGRVNLVDQSGAVINWTSGAMRNVSVTNTTVFSPISGFVWSNASGGSQLGSGPITSVIVRVQAQAITSGGSLVVGGSTAGNLPFTVASGSLLSGAFGLVMSSGDSREFRVSNLNKLFVMSAPGSGVTANILAFGE